MIGQDEAIKEISAIIKKIFLGLKSDLPYSVMFTGKSGVGKTLLAKECSTYLKIPLIKLDMSEYMEPYTVSKIIGSPPGYVGYNDYDNFLEKIKNNPYSIILLDEIDKAHPDVINVFLNILDEGIISDAHGNTVSFKNTIIIMTSNISVSNIGFNQKNSIDIDVVKKLSTPFVNRINKIICFNNLDEKSIKIIIKNKIKEMCDKYKKYQIDIKIDSQVINDLIGDIDYYQYGARKINKVLEERIDNIVIDNIIHHKKTIKVKKILYN